MKRKFLLFPIVFALIFAIFSFSVSAATFDSNSQSPYDILVTNPDYHYAYVYKQNATTYYLVLTVMKPYVNGNNITFNNGGTYSYKEYTLNDNGEWVYRGEYSNTMANYATSVSWSSDNIYDTSGKLAISKDLEMFDPPTEDDETQGFLSKIYNSIKNLSTSIVGGISNSLTALGETILGGIRDIFVPDLDDLDDSLVDFENWLVDRWGITTDGFDDLFNKEQQIDDVYMQYEIHGLGKFNLKIFDSSYLIDGISFFRPIIRGFIVLMILLFNIRQAIGFFGYDAGVISGRNDHIKSAKEK